MEQVPKLVQWLISMGASIEAIGPYPLHALMRLCIRASKCPVVPHPPAVPATVRSAPGALRAYLRPEFSPLTVEQSCDQNSQWLISQSMEGRRGGASFSCLLGPGSCRWPKWEALCVPRQMLAAGWSPGTQGGNGPAGRGWAELPGEPWRVRPTGRGRGGLVPGSCPSSL